MIFYRMLQNVLSRNSLSGRKLRQFAKNDGSSWKDQSGPFPRQPPAAAGWFFSSRGDHHQCLFWYICNKIDAASQKGKGGKLTGLSHILRKSGLPRMVLLAQHILPRWCFDKVCHPPNSVDLVSSESSVQKKLIQIAKEGIFPMPKTMELWFWTDWTSSIIDTVSQELLELTGRNFAHNRHRCWHVYMFRRSWFDRPVF